jgi:hypothetical protein
MTNILETVNAPYDVYTGNRIRFVEKIMKIFNITNEG